MGEGMQLLDTSRTDVFCSFCGLEHTARRRMVVTEANVLMCNECAALSLKIFEETFSLTSEGSSSGCHCAFCGSGEGGDRRFIASPEQHFACNRCVIAAYEMFEEKGALPSPVKPSDFASLDEEDTQVLRKAERRDGGGPVSR